MCIQLYRDFQSSLISLKLKLKGYKIENYTVKDEIAVIAAKQKQNVYTTFPCIQKYQLEVLNNSR